MFWGTWLLEDEVLCDGKGPKDPKALLDDPNNAVWF